MRPILLPLACLLPMTVCLAQVPDSPGGANPSQVPTAPATSAPAPAPSSGGSQSPPQAADNQGTSSFLGKDMPFLDPGSEVVTWDGKSWNISNNRIFKARFEKYLNAPEETAEDSKKYNEILDGIIDRLSPGKISARSTDEAFQMLARASAVEIDANLCNTIADQVYTSWLARKSADRVLSANKTLEEELKRHTWNSKIIAKGSALDAAPPKDPNAVPEWQKRQQAMRDAELTPVLTRMAEINALLKANQLKREVAEFQVKVDFQALIVQLFMQRRFQHVLIATRFYRSIFNDGTSQLNVGDDAKNLFSKTSGMPPTVSTLDTMTNEIIRDVHEGVQAFNFLLEKDELESASNRLAESFLIGEYMPDIRTLSRDKKRQTLDFVQKSNKLISAIEIKDYTLAEKLVKELEGTAKDFDNSKPMAAIETSKKLSAFHMAKAKNAAVSGDKDVFETELKAAAAIWPRNPDLTEMSETIFKQSDVVSRAVVDFDQLVSQKNYRQIYDDRMRFIAAVAMYPEKQQQLQEVLENMGEIEKAIVQAQEIEKHGDYAGAWESAERAYLKHSDDNKLNMVRSDLSSKAAEFVRALKQAEELEKTQPGSSMAWYLKARKTYPNSEFAKDGIQRITKGLLPDAT